MMAAPDPIEMRRSRRRGWMKKTASSRSSGRSNRDEKEQTARLGEEDIATLSNENPVHNRSPSAQANAAAKQRNRHSEAKQSRDCKSPLCDQREQLNSPAFQTDIEPHGDK
jgi:hypothetical protein